MKYRSLSMVVAVTAILSAVSGTAGTLENVIQKGLLQCGSNTSLGGFGLPDSQGKWSGLDVDYCRAIAAAVLKDPAKVKFIPLAAKDRFTALQSGEIDVLVRNTTWTLSRDTSGGATFGGVNYYDGQGFMVHKSLGVKSAMELNGATICVQQGTTTELNLTDYFRSNKMTYKPVVFAGSDETTKSYDSGRCDALTVDASALFAERLKLAKPDDNVILPEIISKEPLGPAVRQGDDKWAKIVMWTHYAMLTAEELGVTKANVDEMLKSTNPDVKRLLGTEGKFGEGLGLGNDWAYLIIKNVGNYGETFERNVGSGSQLKIARGLNALWSKGGLQYAPPIR